MPFVPVANTVMVEAIFEIDGQRVENTSYWEFATDPVLTDITELLTELRIVISEQLMPLLSLSIRLVELVGTLLTAVDSLSVSQALATPVSGGSGDESMSTNVAYCITFKTAQRGRSFRGRNFICGIPIGQVSTNTIGGGFRTGLLDYYETMRAAMSELGWDMVVVSRFTNGAPRPTGVTSPITSFSTFDDTVDSQRRRLPGRGT